MWIVKHRKFFFTLSGALVTVALGCVMFFGLNFGIDFVGGTILEVEYTQSRPEKDRVELRLDQLEMGGYSLRATDDAGYLLRTKDLNEEERGKVLDALSLGGADEVTVIRLNTIGPVIGHELRSKAFIAIAVVIITIVCFVAFAFRSVREEQDEDGVVKKKQSARIEPKGVSSWTYGWIAIVALLHDIILPLGLFAVLGQSAGAEIDVLFIMAILAILGYSVNDTIVVFDRVRENLLNNAERGKEEEFEETVGRSLDQTLARSINTSITTLLVLVSLAIFGGEPTRFFALTLIAGVVAGTYSSIALASPLLVAAEKVKRKTS